VQRLAALDGGHAPDRALARWTSVFVARGDVAEVALVELPLSFVIGGLGFRHQRLDARALPLEDLFTMEVTPIGGRRQSTPIAS
jgi:hypothetical protein